MSEVKPTVCYDYVCACLAYCACMAYCACWASQAGCGHSSCYLELEVYPGFGVEFLVWVVAASACQLSDPRLVKNRVYGAFPHSSLGRSLFCDLAGALGCHRTPRLGAVTRGFNGCLSLRGANCWVSSLGRWVFPAGRGSIATVGGVERFWGLASGLLSCRGLVLLCCFELGSGQDGEL